MRDLTRLVAWVTGRGSSPRPPAESMREPLCGWRAWQVVETRHGLALSSWCLGTVWPARRELQSRCYVHGHRPAFHHACGIHAFDERDDAFAYAEGPQDRLMLFDRRPAEALGIAVGRVSGWGRVVRHARGWRSQFAYPYDLYLLSGDRALARSLSNRYAVDATSQPPLAGPSTAA